MHTKTIIRQLLHVSDTWKRALEFALQENVILKNHLAEVLNNHDISREFLVIAEKFQHDFTSEDEMIRLLRIDIVKFDKLLEQEAKANTDVITDSIHRLYANIASDVENVIREFSKMKFEFNRYMSDSMLASQQAYD